MSLNPAILSAALKAYTAGKPHGLMRYKDGRPVLAFHCDGRNLYLQVSPSGAMSWLYRWKVDGKSKVLGLGSFTGTGRAGRVSLETARLKADKIRIDLARDIDPLAAKRKARLAKRATFKTMLEEHLTQAELHWKTDGKGKSDQARSWRASFDNHAPQLLKMSVEDIGRDEVLSVLQPLWGRKIGEDMRHRLQKVLAYAKGLGHREGKDNPAQWENLSDVLLVKPAKKGGSNGGHAAMPEEDVPAFMAQLLKRKGSACKGLAFTILTVVRTANARLARWPEINFDAATWTIPGERMKGEKNDGRVDHIVPLPDAALELLRSIPRVEGNPYIFAGRDFGAPVGSSAFDDKLCDPVSKGGFGLRGKATVHGFRSTFADFVSERFPDWAEEREFCLAHVLSKTVAAYRRKTSVETRRQLMQAWADHCMGKTHVVALKRVAA